MCGGGLEGCGGRTGACRCGRGRARRQTPPAMSQQKSIESGQPKQTIRLLLSRRSFVSHSYFTWSALSEMWDCTCTPGKRRTTSPSPRSRASLQVGRKLCD